jgi:hypothetical protein
MANGAKGPDGVGRVDGVGGADGADGKREASSSSEPSFSSSLLRCARCGGGTEAPPSASPGSPGSPGSITGSLTCRHCGAASAAPPSARPVPRHELFAALRAAELGHFRDLAPEAQSVSCRGCGAVTVTTHRAVRCPFCSGSLVTAEPADGILPDAVAPFSLDEAAAAAAVTRWLGRRWFAPSDLVRVARRDRLQAVYLPYWSFSVVGRATYVGERGDASTRTERRVGSYGRITEHRVRHVKWRRRHGQVDRELVDHLVPATTSLPPALLAALGPWRGEALVPFSAAHLQGTLAERYSVDLRSGFATAQRELEQKLRAAACFDIGGDEQRVSHLRVKHEGGSFRHVLLPVWSTALRYRGRVYRLAVNAQTGALAGERPYSRGKLALAAGVALLAIAAAITAWMLLRKPAPPPPDPDPSPPEDVDPIEPEVASAETPRSSSLLSPSSLLSSPSLSSPSSLSAAT